MVSKNSAKQTFIELPPCTHHCARKMRKPTPRHMRTREWGHFAELLISLQPQCADGRKNCFLPSRISKSRELRVAKLKLDKNSISECLLYNPHTVSHRKTWEEKEQSITRTVTKPSKFLILFTYNESLPETLILSAASSAYPNGACPFDQCTHSQVM